MKLFDIIRFIFNHPFNSDHRIKALLRFIKWQINCRINPYPIIYPFTENSKFITWKGLVGATGNIYCGLLEYKDMSFLLHLLRPNDLFVDVGANVGVYTILASAEIKARTISIEPIPSTFKNLKNNIIINEMENLVQSLNIGLGSQAGELKFTSTLDTVNHVATEEDKNVITVKVDTLDHILSQEQVPVLLKIDVEGFESEVLNGAKSVLSNKELKAIIIELNGSGIKYGYDDSNIHNMLIEYGFKPFDYNPTIRQLTEISSFGSHNTIYIRDLAFVEDRIKTARKVRIGVELKEI